MFIFDSHKQLPPFRYLIDLIILSWVTIAGIFGCFNAGNHPLIEMTVWLYCIALATAWFVVIFDVYDILKNECD